MDGKRERSFKTALFGGFSRRDVMNYVGALVKEHRDEIEAYRASSDKLRKENDELKAGTALLKDQAGRVDELLARNSALERDAAEAARKLSESEAALEAKQSELDTLMEQVRLLNQRRSEDESQLAEYQIAKNRVAEMELMAYRRAELIEQEALQGVNNAKAALKDTVASIRGAFNDARGETEAVAYTIRGELRRIQDWLGEFPKLFDEADERLRKIETGDGHVVTEFVPPAFDTPEDTLMEDTTA